jgi:hypothetical protein
MNKWETEPTIDDGSGLNANSPLEQLRMNMTQRRAKTPMTNSILKKSTFHTSKVNYEH